MNSDTNLSVDDSANRESAGESEEVHQPVVEVSEEREVTKRTNQCLRLAKRGNR